MRDQSDRLGTLIPTIRVDDPKLAQRTGQATKRPGTENPSIDELDFEPVRADLDVAARLQDYAERSTRIEGDDVLRLGLPDAFATAHRSARDYLSAQEEYFLAAIRLLIERHRWGPRLFNDTSVTMSGGGDAGRFEHALDVLNTLRATQRLPYGGEVEARWLVRATDQLRDQATGGYRQSSELALNATIPLLRGAGLVAREDLIQQERNLVYAARDFERFRRELLVEVARDYFSLIEAMARIENQRRQLQSRVLADEETKARVESGLREPFQADITANAVRQSESALANLLETYILELERFKVRLGLPPTAPIEILPLELDLLAPEVTMKRATELALDYRLDLQTSRDELDDLRRAVRNAVNDTLPDLDVFAEVGIPTDQRDDTAGLGLDGGDLDYRVGGTLSLPLDRRIERLGVRQAQIRLERGVRNYTQFRDNIIIEARQAVREIDLARFQLELAEEQVRINERGLEDLNLRDNADPQSILDRENDLLNAENARDSARTDLRNAVLNYLLATGQLRVEPAGTFAPLPGMLVEPDEDATDAGA